MKTSIMMTIDEEIAIKLREMKNYSAWANKTFKEELIKMGFTSLKEQEANGKVEFLMEKYNLSRADADWIDKTITKKTFSIVGLKTKGINLNSEQIIDIANTYKDKI